MTVGKTQRNIFILMGAGAAAGILGGLLGIGSGTLLVPMFTFLFGFNPRRAHGTSLAVVVGLSLVGVIGYSGHDLVDWRIALCILIGSVVGAIFGGILIAVIKSHLLRYVLCIILGLVGIRMIVSGFGIDLFSTDFDQTIQGTVQQVAAYLTTGFISGVLSAVLGIGTGLIIVPVLVTFMGIGQQDAQGISLAVMLPTAVMGTVMHLRAGNVDLRVGKWATMGAVIGALSGLTMAVRLQSKTLQVIFGIMMVIILVLLALKKDNYINAKTDIGVSNE